MSKLLKFKEYYLDDNGRAIFERLAWITKGVVYDIDNMRQTDHSDRRGASEAGYEHSLPKLKKELPDQYRKLEDFWNEGVNAARLNPSEKQQECAAIEVSLLLPEHLNKQFIEGQEKEKEKQIEEQMKMAKKFALDNITKLGLGVTYSVGEVMESQQIKGGKQRFVKGTKQYAVDFLICTRQITPEGFNQEKHHHFLNYQASWEYRQEIGSLWKDACTQEIKREVKTIEQHNPELGLYDKEQPSTLSNETSATLEQVRGFDIPIITPQELTTTAPEITNPSDQVREGKGFNIPVIKPPEASSLNIELRQTSQEQPSPGFTIPVTTEGLTQPSQSRDNQSIFENLRAANDNANPELIKAEIAEVKEQMQALTLKLQGLEYELERAERGMVHTIPNQPAQEQTLDLLAGVYDEPTDHTRAAARQELKPPTVEDILKRYDKPDHEMTLEERKERSKLMMEATNREREREQQERERYPERYQEGYEGLVR